MTDAPTMPPPRVDEIADGIHRISCALPPEVIPGGFTMNQFLIVDERALLFHTGPRRLFPAIREAVASVAPLERLAYVAFSHVESDECGSLNEWLAAAPNAVPVCSALGAMVSVSDLADRPPRGLADGETLVLGSHTVQWIDTPHLPHGMDTGYLFEQSTRTLLCGDLFAQPGSDVPAITDGDIWGPSEGMRQAFPYASTKDAPALLDKLAKTEPQVLACMHGASYRGDGAALLRKLAGVL